MSKKDKGRMTADPVTYQIPDPAGGVRMETFIPWTVKRGVRREVITPVDAPQQFREEAEREQQTRKTEEEGPLVRALGLAHYWQRLLDEGKCRSITEIAAAEGMDVGQVSRIARLVQLAPHILETCLKDNECGAALERLNRRALPVNWRAQQVEMFALEHEAGRRNGAATGADQKRGNDTQARPICPVARKAAGQQKPARPVAGVGKPPSD